MSQPTRTIPLTRGFVAIVDADDYERLSRSKWHASYNKGTHSWYAVRKAWIGVGKYERIQMGREVLGLKHGDPIQADHIRTGLTLVNTKDNLREATRSQNCQNRRLRSDNQARFKGVSWNPKAGAWRVQITLNGKNVLVGHFQDPVVAAKAYDARARQEFGKFAPPNFPLEQPAFELPIAA